MHILIDIPNEYTTTDFDMSQDHNYKHLNYAEFEVNILRSIFVNSSHTIFVFFFIYFSAL